MVGGVIPAAGLSRGLGHPMYDPLYQTAVRLNVPLAVHGGSSAGLGLDLYDSFVKILVMEHAVAQQIHFTSYLLDGAPVRFPDSKNGVSRSRGRLGAVLNGEAGREI